MDVIRSQSQNTPYGQIPAPVQEKPKTLAGNAVEIVRNHPIACALGCAAVAGAAFGCL